MKLRLTLGRGTKTVTRDWTFPVTRREDDVFVGRLWAQRRLEQLRRLDQQQEETRKAIIALSQEWSLLSPHTAFLVLESEQDYQRWGLDRRVRRRYWKPAEARPEAPLPPKWVEQFRPSQQSGPSDQDFAEAVRKAREALAAKDFARAQQLLRAVASSPQAAKSDEFQVLRRQALEGLRSRVAAEQREARRGLLDPASPSARPDFQPSVTTLLGSAFRADPDFVRRHPYAERLLQQVDMATLAQGRTLQQFAEQLADLTGANVRLDRKALDDSASTSTCVLKATSGERNRRLPPENHLAIRSPAPAHADPFGGSVTDAQKIGASNDAGGRRVGSR